MLPSETKIEIELTYITMRGKWYDKSWKSDPKKGFGLVTNIGIHFFDMLHYLFGDLKESYIHLNKSKKASGYLKFAKSNVKWFLSIDGNDLPKVLKNQKRTFREIKINGELFNFSDGFDDLHTESYISILNGNGFGIEDTRGCIETVEKSENPNLI